MNVAALPEGLRRFALHDIAPESWRNGGGLTRQVATGRLAPPESSAAEADAWDWRLSVADITAEGAFSVFPGVERSAALVAGSGLTLRGGVGDLHFARPGAIHAFAGETALAARLAGGPAQLFNVMVRRERAAARLCAHRGGMAVGLELTHCCALLVARGEFRVSLRHGAGRSAIELQLGAGEGLLVQDGAARLEIEGSSPDDCLVQASIQGCQQDILWKSS